MRAEGVSDHDPDRSPDFQRVSVHGGHSAEFCSHASDALEEVVLRYVERDFSWVGITEHMPAAREEMIPPEERSAGFSAAGMLERFSSYIDKCRSLQSDYSDRIEILVGFEAEIYSGYQPFLRNLVREFRPDYIVGSVHHVNDIPIDATPELYAEAARCSGGTDALYCDYFDLQLELIEEFEPAVVGHFDLIRLLDVDYASRLTRTAIWERVDRNLRAIRASGLILDFNVRALAKGQPEPYVSAPILQRALELGVAIAPGDDSHGVAGVGLHCDEGMRILAARGFPTRWPKPGT